MPSRKQTIKAFAQDFFLRVNYVDIYGRRVGYDYDYILAEIRRQFPNARTSKNWLRRMAYEITDRMPMRRRSRRGLSEGYAMSELLKSSQATGLGLRHRSIADAIRDRFPDQPIPLLTIRRLENRLKFLKFDVPERKP